MARHRSLEVVTLTNEQLSYRVTGDGAAVLVLLNVADDPFGFEIDLEVDIATSCWQRRTAATPAMRLATRA